MCIRITSVDTLTMLRDRVLFSSSSKPPKCNTAGLAITMEFLAIFVYISERKERKEVMQTASLML